MFSSSIANQNEIVLCYSAKIEEQSGRTVVKLEQVFKKISWLLNHGVAIKEVKHTGPVIR